MNFHRVDLPRSLHHRAARLAVAASFFLTASAQAAITWDGQNGTNWWFDPINWNVNSNSNLLIPPTQDADADPQTPPSYSAADAQINIGTSGAWNVTGEGVVYDPTNDPGFGNTYPMPAGGYGKQVIGPLYISRHTTNQNLLTIKGDLTVGFNSNSSAFQVGRSGNAPAGYVNEGNEGRIVHLSGKVLVPTTNLDIGSYENPGSGEGSIGGWGNGVYDYRGGILDVYNNLTNHGIRLSHGSSTNGTGGHGRFIMHNPATDGHVRTYTYVSASDRTNGDGINRGVGITEFHFENGGTRPIQVVQNLSINNGLDNSPQGSFAASTRSSRLELVLHEAPTVDEFGKPQLIGLFDVNFGNIVGGTITGTGDLDGNTVFNDDRVFSSADASKNYYPRSDWTRFPTLDEEDFLIEAAFGSTLYRWEVSYTGDITWVGNGNTGQVASVSGTGGVDVVLIGHSSVDIGPAGDHDGNGVVDARDYVVWRKSPGSYGGPQGYTDWVNNFGAGGGGGVAASGTTGAVPEPSSVALALLSVLALVGCRRR